MQPHFLGPFFQSFSFHRVWNNHLVRSVDTSHWVIVYIYNKRYQFVFTTTLYNNVLISHTERQHTYISFILLLHAQWLSRQFWASNSHHPLVSLYGLCVPCQHHQLIGCEAHLKALNCCTSCPWTNIFLHPILFHTMT